ncbi:1-deoxy-D-xylulose-5-phosphate reductoisomerase [Sphingomonas prati]|uniref:1-deoxy-D-xylulose 5-phosphate reductoisomerase n=1 Tax=Sphingomonas prati TaxID=1843237 RepID=A0A7W9BR45_9SPHN|nr:1-deoxy-D-xylulose-5-phosphate reductoisomerase [Sphingomonas prati]MBB5728550.1 1-deoxy-D-xylulose-5-phosphate reductoisomerase [Sphingomonas prati]GGE72892.1 1-deoxy-D-xylulose 5-phosphate reductoisomerase [Sphingomonas prati]
MTRRTVTVLGATGSVGRSTLDLIERTPDAFQVKALTAHRDVAGLAAAAIRTNAELAVIADPDQGPALATALAGTGIGHAAGADAVRDAAGLGADWTMAAIVGCAGLVPVMAAIETGKTVALANKEALVSAGDLMIRATTRTGATLLPVDSEHNAIFQCLAGSRIERVRRILLTASGGPFRTATIERMRTVTPAEAVCHPNWSMGAKISIDSATMMNKGLELIEADHLFPIGSERIEIVVHPQSVIHSMVDYIDGSTLAQMGTPDMRTPIAHALAWPDRMDGPSAPLDFTTLGRLDFEAPDPQRFPALRLAREAAVAGGGRPAILNAANEIAVAAFLASRIGFLDIAGIVATVLDRYDPPVPATIDDVLSIDRQARRIADGVMKDMAA